jgi:hypothetical protein
MSDTIKIGHIVPRNGCTKFHRRSSKDHHQAHGSDDARGWSHMPGVTDDEAGTD